MFIFYILGFFLIMGVISLLCGGIKFFYRLLVRPVLNTGVGHGISCTLKGVASFAGSIALFTFFYFLLIHIIYKL